MNKLKDLLHELRCDIAAIPINKENNTEIKNAQETLAKAFNELLRLYNVVGQSEQFYCSCSRAKGLEHDEKGMPYCIECQKLVQ